MTQGSPIPNLDAIKPEASSPQAIDPLAKAEQEDYEKQRQKAKLEDLIAEVGNRKRYTTWLFWLMVGWISVVLMVVVASGVRQPTTPPSVESVLPWWTWLVVVILFVFIALGLWLPHELEAAAEEKGDKPRWKRVRASISRVPLSWFILPGLAVAIIVASCVVVYLAPLGSTTPLPAGWKFSEWVVAFELSDTVILALIGGTTANVVGLFYIVARYLFPRRDNGGDDR